MDDSNMCQTGKYSDCSIYEVDFGDGNYYEYYSNIILENLYMKAGDQLESYSMLEATIDHNKDKHTVSKERDGIILIILHVESES